MSSATQTALQDYLSLVRQEFERVKGAAECASGVRVLKTDDQVLLDAAETLERSAEFLNLDRVSNSEFELASPEPIGLYFRLSGVYQELFAGKSISVQGIWPDYSDALSSEVRTVTHLAALEYVGLACGDCIDCGSFQIRRFTRAELDSLLRNEARRIFFPSACMDTEELQNWSFAVVKESRQIVDRGRAKLTFDPGLKPRFSPYPAPVEKALATLALYDWRLLDPATKERDTWTLAFFDGRAFIPKPVVPFVISASGRYFDLPDRGPDLHAHDWWIGPYRVRPNRDGADLFVIDQPTAVQLAGFMSRTSQAIERARKLNAGLVDTMLGFHLRAFTSHGLEELLWHMTAIEAALGEKVDGLTNLLKSRVALILEHTEGRRRTIRKRFDELYEMRCNLVHGKAEVGNQKIDFDHFIDARRFSRSVVLWVLHYLNHVHGILEGRIQDAPTREDMLKVLDMNEAARGRMVCLLKGAPDGFPNVDDWIK